MTVIKTGLLLAVLGIAVVALEVALIPARVVNYWLQGDEA